MLSKRTPWISAILLLAGIAIYVYSVVMLPVQDMLITPKGYEKIATINMAEEHQNSVVYKFDLKDPQRLGCYVWTNAKENKTLLLEGSESKIGLLTEKSKLTDAQFNLQPGQYGITLTNGAQSGMLVIYMLKTSIGQN